jgi:hypothetical protein
MRQYSEEMTAREYQQHQHDLEMFDRQAAQVLAVKDRELALAKLEAKWSSWLKIPITIIKLPVLILFGIAYIVATARKHEPSAEFWKFIH